MAGSSQSLTLQVSNQSFDIDPVEIEITIDGQVVVHGEFELQGEGLAQHNWKHYEIQVEAGPHHLRARSTQVHVVQESEFETPATELVTIAFWSGRGDPSGEQVHYLTIHAGRGPAATM
jgi:hypothetical protein